MMAVISPTTGTGINERIGELQWDLVLDAVSTSDSFESTLVRAESVGAFLPFPVSSRGHAPSKESVIGHSESPGLESLTAPK